ncbi:MAG: hypothetical protein A2506_05770 [Elusimicrobia bacterium RIFOXYD12_FULL_66_9]|nr:MAG: hypothetical protein A2506_05770 [Elusimicrobia bacterium RIFOXYD12_FULL_66_9]
MGFWDGKKVLVTGGAGFIGSHLVTELLRRGSPRATVADDFRSGSRDRLAGLPVRVTRCDLLDSEAARRACRGQEIVLNLAARVGGVAYNAAHPATMFRDNLRLSANILEGARRAGAERVLVVSSACVYPREAPAPTKESAGFRGMPETSCAGYSWAKRMAEYQAEAYGLEFGLRTAIARPYNCYGPRDHFDPEISHVIPSLLRRILLGEDPIRVWGDGAQTRSFLYAEDLARGLADAAEHGVGRGPINIGSPEEVSIAELIAMILEETGSKARVVFDSSKPAGQPRRACDTSKARKELGFTARVPLREGLRRTISWLRARGLRSVLGGD